MGNINENYITKACEFLNLDENDIYGKLTTDKLSIGRYIIWYHLHYEKGLSANRIARIFGRGSNAIFKGIAKIKVAINTQNKYKRLYSEYCDKLA